MFKLRWPNGSLVLDRCRVMGILNVTPDSFSDGGKFIKPQAAVKRAWEIAQEGADILDVGAESTRPGAQAITEDEERGRLWSILDCLTKENFPIPISLDSTKPALVAEAFEKGWIQVANDVGGLRDPKMVEVIKEFQIPVILMHMFGTPRTMQQDYHYKDVVADLISFFQKRLKETEIDDNVVLDPGIGFGKSVDHNLTILNRLQEFAPLGCPLMVGASRKFFVGKVLNLKTEDRLEGSLAAAAIAAYNGASIVRVHDVQATVRVLEVVEAIRRVKS